MNKAVNEPNSSKAAINQAQSERELSSLTQRLGLLVALVAPIKLSWSYAALSAFLISWLYDHILSDREFFRHKTPYH
jgi:hypothetical protein